MPNRQPVEDDISEEATYPLSAQDMLPASLDSPGMTKIDLLRLESKCEEYTESPLQHAAIKVIVAIVATLPLEVFEVSLDMER